MPDIAPVLAVNTPAVAASPAPAGAVAPATPVAADGSAADFLGQLKAALKTLAGVVSVLPTAPTQPAVVPAVVGDALPPTASSSSDDAPAAPRTVDQPTDDLADLMAALGLVPVPVQPPVLPAATPVDADSASVSASVFADATTGMPPLLER